MKSDFQAELPSPKKTVSIEQVIGKKPLSAAEYSSRGGLVVIAYQFYVSKQAFVVCDALSRIDLPGNLIMTDTPAFYSCGGLEEIVFHGEAPETDSTVSRDVGIKAVYPAGNSTWTERQC